MRKLDSFLARRRELADAYDKALKLAPGMEDAQFNRDLIAQLKTRIAAEATPDTVVALLGVGSLFGLARVSTLVEGIKDTVPGRLLVFFPGEHHPENHTYRLLDARDGWNYLAVPLLAVE